MGIVNPGLLTREGAEAINRLLAQQPHLIPATSYGGIGVTNWRGGSFTDNLIPNPLFPVYLTAVTSSLYSWTEQISTGPSDTDWVDLPGGRTGTNLIQPAFEPNGVAIDVSSPVLAYLRRSTVSATLGQTYEIVAIGAGGSGASGGTVDGETIGGAPRSSPATLQSIPNATWTKVDWAGTSGTPIIPQWEPGASFWDGHSKLTSLITGVYLFGTEVTFDANATGVRGVAIIFSGAGMIVHELLPACPSGDTCINLTGIPLQLSGQSIEVWVYQSSGGSLNLVTDNPFGTLDIGSNFWILLLGGGGSITPAQITAVANSDSTNATATMANITLDNNPAIVTGQEYAGRMDIWCNNSVAAEGIQFDFAGGSATFTNFKACLTLVGSATGTFAPGTVLSTAYNSAMNFSNITGETAMVIIFSFTVNAGGTLIPRFAENSHTLGTATVEARTNIRIDPLA